MHYLSHRLHQVLKQQLQSTVLIELLDTMQLMVTQPVLQALP